MKIKSIIAITFIVIMILTTSCSFTEHKITKDKFDKVRMGMSYYEVVGIMGENGELISHVALPPTQYIDGIENKMYAWKNPDGSNMNVQFQNDKAIGKAQLGLK